jgi:Amt family ammonium transporter
MVTQSEELDSTQDPAIISLQQNIDDLFHITMGCFVFFMQPGFAFLEAGSVR